LRVRSLGPGESFADTIWELDDGTVFAGDIAYNGMHAFLADGQWQRWLDATDRLERELPDDVTATDYRAARSCWAVDATTSRRS
jgi:hypothetical protein